MKGFKNKLNDLLTGSWLRGLFCASANSFSYTLPSYAPNADPRTASGISKPSTNPTAFGRMLAKTFSKRLCKSSMSALFMFINYLKGNRN